MLPQPVDLNRLLFTFSHAFYHGNLFNNPLLYRFGAEILSTLTHSVPLSPPELGGRDGTIAHSAQQPWPTQSNIGATAAATFDIVISDPNIKESAPSTLSCVEGANVRSDALWSVKQTRGQSSNDHPTRLGSENKERYNLRKLLPFTRVFFMRFVFFFPPQT